MKSSQSPSSSVPPRRKRFYHGSSLVFLVVLAAVYSYGWYITDIDLRQFGNVRKIFPIVKAMLSPSLFEWNVRKKSVLTSFAYPSELFQPPDEHLVLSIYQGEIGDTITVEGRKLPPSRSGMLKWISLGKESREIFLTEFTTGSHGELVCEVTVPEQASMTNLLELQIIEEKTLPYLCQQCFIVPSLKPGATADSPSVELSVYTGRVSDLLELHGERFEPNTQAQIYWVSGRISLEPVLTVQVDSAGNFRGTMAVPPLAGEKGKETTLQYLDTVTEVRTGGFHLTEAAGMVLKKILETVFLALIATTIAVIITVPLSFLAAGNVMKKNRFGTFVYYVVRGIFNIVRSVEPLIMAMVFSIWVGIGPFAGVLALAFHSVASLGKLYSEQIETIDPGPIDAIVATGAKRLQVIRYGIVPQIIPSFLAFTIYRWDINVRMSTIIGFVGGGGIGFILQQ
ncbi:MAG: phosphate/phosphonate ABC transporter permease, partial [bacterium]|nr:phosphate/phosphonate ABC transporter permease [bacterium]